MTPPRDPDRLIRAFLDEGDEYLQDQVYDAVRADIDKKRQRAFIGPWRTPTMNGFLKIAATAAAAVLIAIVGFNLLPGSPAPGSGPSATALPSVAETSIADPSAAEPSVTEPSATFAASIPPLSPLPEGEHLLWNGGTFGAEVLVTISAPDWFGESTGQSQRRGILRKDDTIAAPDGAGLMLFASATLLSSAADVYVYGDPCRWETTKPDAAVATVDEAVAALSTQRSREASAPVDVSVAGHAGKSITLTVPHEATLADCDQGEYRTMVQAYFSEEIVLVAQDPGQVDKLWILNVNGDLVIFVASYHDETPQAVIDELDDIVASATIDSP